jgi:hypothetical protein
LATAANAALAATPDNTFRVKRFITDLRMKGDSTANYTSWGCHAVGPAGRGTHEPVAGGPRSIVGATQKPPTEGL